ncbi:MAG: hypothetical protein COA36_05290 [Desulfotalea sp.]|nr:MAG: hypothetical protein COA36_05290 [Desulfotalea sp.]
MLMKNKGQPVLRQQGHKLHLDMENHHHLFAKVKRLSRLTLKKESMDSKGRGKLSCEIPGLNRVVRRLWYCQHAGAWRALQAGADLAGRVAVRVG